MTYLRTGGGVTATEPAVAGQPATEFAAFIFDRLICFVEEVTAHCLKGQMPADIAITQLPRAGRPTEVPERFRVTLANGGMPCWTIAFHASSFEET